MKSLFYKKLILIFKRLIVLSVMVMLISATVLSAQQNQTNQPVIFLGNSSLPPLNYIKNGKASGLAVELTEAIAGRMHRPVVIRLMNWEKAQQLVLEGKADALIQINSNPERMKIFDFSEPLLLSEFSIFISSDCYNIRSIQDLQKQKVGVEAKGLPVLLIKEVPQVTIEIITDYFSGFNKLIAGEIDAVIADRWVGGFVLSENKIHGVKLVEKPVSVNHSAIAVKKGNISLLNEINMALRDIREDGTYKAIIDSWRSQEIIFITRQQEQRQLWLFSAVTTAFIATLCFIFLLLREIKKRRRAEETLRKKINELNGALEQIRTLRGIIPICSGCKKIRDDTGYWQQVEIYIRDHSEVEFSHSLCPDCAKRLYPRYFKDGDEKQSLPKTSKPDMPE